MITTLICFSVLSVVCLVCLGVVSSNNEISNINYKSTKVSYKVRGGSELVYSKVLKEANKAIYESTLEVDNKKYFTNYFLGNNKYNFISNIENINTDNIEINVINDKLYLENECIVFDITCKSEDDNIKKSSRCSFKIDTNFDFNNIDLNSIVTKYNYQEI